MTLNELTIILVTINIAIGAVGALFGYLRWKDGRKLLHIKLKQIGEWIEEKDSE